MPLDPVLLGLAALRLLLLEGLLRLQQAGVAGVLGDGVVLRLPPQDVDVVGVGQGVDEASVVELRPAGPAEDLVGDAGVDQLLRAEGALHQRREDHRARREVDAGRQGLGADDDGEELALEEVLDNDAILRQEPRVVDADPAVEQALELGANSKAEVERVDPVV